MKKGIEVYLGVLGLAFLAFSAVYLGPMFFRSGPHPDVVRDQLFDAAWQGDAERFAGLVAGEPNMMATTDDGRTLLHLAVHGRDRSIIAAAIDAGVPLDAPDQRGDTALHVAVQEKLAPGVKALVDAGADLAVRNKLRGSTPLHLAAANGYDFGARYLVRNGADVDALNEDGIAPLYLAIGNLNVKMTELLVEAGADPEAPYVLPALLFNTCEEHLERDPDVEGRQEPASDFDKIVAILEQSGWTGKDELYLPGARQHHANQFSLRFLLQNVCLHSMDDLFGETVRDTSGGAGGMENLFSPQTDN